MKNIKLIVSEVEGVLTTGQHPIDELGNTSTKEYYLPDFEAISRLKRICPVVFISTENAINYNLFQRKQIPFYWAKKDKAKLLCDILRRYNVTAEDVIYIGSKLSDLHCMDMVPTSFTTNNILLANTKDKGYTYRIFESYPGEGIMTELYFNIINGEI